MRGAGEILLLSCYELGHPPYAVASALGFLARAGFSPSAIDLAVEPLDEARLRGVKLVAISTPMHTALRLGLAAAEKIRAAAPEARVLFFGLYASHNAELLLGPPSHAHGRRAADFVISGEAEEALVSLCEDLAA